MIKVTYKDGIEKEFDYEYFEHYAENKVFVLINSKGKNKCMIPDRNVLEIEEVEENE